MGGCLPPVSLRETPPEDILEQMKQGGIRKVFAPALCDRLAHRAQPTPMDGSPR